MPRTWNKLPNYLNHALDDSDTIVKP
jgi:hypothetical protein